VFFTGVEENKHVVDNQMVQMQFENGVSATLKMLFAGEPGRRINLFGSHGEIVFDEIPGTIEIKTYGNEKQVVNINDLINEDAGYGHGGGDYGLISDLYSILTGDKTDYTSLEESVECHLIGIAAEESRLNGGITLKVH
jgi:predicted dehydrogenase